MTTQTHNPANNTSTQTIGSMLPALESRAHDFLKELRLLDPDLAARALQVRVFTKEDFDPSQGRPPHGVIPTSCDWIWFREVPAYHTFVYGLVAALFVIRRTLSQYVGDLVSYAVRKQDASLLRLAQQVAVASRKWSTQDIEARLGLSLDEAYRKAGVMPRWSETVGEYARSERTAVDTREVDEFLVDCIEGLLCDDDFWTEYTRRLFRDTK